MNIFAIIIIFLFLSGCESFTVSKYRPSVENKNIILTNNLNKKINIRKFTQAPSLGKSKMCRGAGKFRFREGKDFAGYVEDSFVREFKQAGIYDKKSKDYISVNIDKIEFSTFPEAIWSLKATIDSNNKSSESIDISYEFDTSFSALVACQNVADSFPFAVEKLITKYLETDSFSDLAHK